MELQHVDSANNTPVLHGLEMELLPGFLNNSCQCILNRKKSMDSTFEATVETCECHGVLTGFFAVHSGYGGASAAALARKHFREELLKQAGYKSTEPVHLADALKRALLITQQSLYDEWDRTNKLEGTNSLAVLVKKSHALCINAGGGMAVVCAAGGEIKVLAEPTPRLEEIVRPEVLVRELLPDDEFIIIGCPSLWSKLDPIQAAMIVRSALRKYKDLDYAVKKLCYMAQHSGAPGNLTVMVILLNAEMSISASNSGANSRSESISAQKSHHSYSTDGRSENSSINGRRVEKKAWFTRKDKS
mmetsp:Transcript_7726/g.14029  ORF Transcript_7726/g.14029 Transcript_7726/m.14029 type:complete len:303 (-) Transcript_7726:1051-1959(-)